MRKIAALLIDLYRYLISPVLRLIFGRGCRFNPTCSAYSKEAILRFGILRGGKLSIKRISRCHPFNDFLFEPVPEKAQG